MRCMVVYKQTFWYALYTGKTPIYDAQGNETGESEVSYSNPVETRGHISAARGETYAREFGENEEYDRVIVLEDPSVAIDEYSVLWIGVTPQLNAHGQLDREHGGRIITPWNYVVRKVARSFNSVSIAISKVNAE